MFNKAMNFVKRLKRENFCFSNYSFQIWLLICSMKISAQYGITLLAGQKKHRGMGRGYQYSNSMKGKDHNP